MSNNILNFREAKTSDIPKLLELEQCVVEAERPFNASIKSEGAFYYDLEQLIACDNALLLVIEIGNEIAATGYAQIRNSKPSLAHEQHSYLGFMYVSPQFRGQGINSILIEKLIEWSKLKGVNTLYLDVYSENQSAIKAYEKVGFKSSLVEMKLTLAE